MAKKNRDAKRRPPGTPEDWEYPGPAITQATVDIHDVTNTLPNLHHMIVQGKAPDGEAFEVLRHINNSCYWIRFMGRMYFVSTEALVTALMTAIEPHARQATQSDKAEEKDNVTEHAAGEGVDVSGSS